MRTLILTFFIGALITQIQAQPEAWEWNEKGPGVKSILFMGDNSIQLREHPEEAFKFVIPTLDAATFRFLNLEGAIAGASKDPSVPVIPHKNWQHSEKDHLAALTAAGIDAVADVVLGHGPHKYQKIEMYQGKPIRYSLAQFVFDDRRAGRFSRHREGLLLRFTVKDKKINGISLIPSWREDYNLVRLFDPNVGKGKEIYKYLESVNEEGARLRIVGNEIIVEGYEY